MLIDRYSLYVSVAETANHVRAPLRMVAPLGNNLKCFVLFILVRFRELMALFESHCKGTTKTAHLQEQTKDSYPNL